jgi:hypothetical protein
VPDIQSLLKNKLASACPKDLLDVLKTSGVTTQNRARKLRQITLAVNTGKAVIVAPTGE